MKTYGDIQNEVSEQELTPEKIMELACWQERFQEHIHNIAEQYAKLKGHGRGSITDIEFCGPNIIEFNVEEYFCGCCGPDSTYMSMPTSYLWDQDWQEQAKAQIEEDKRKEEERKAAEAKKQAEAKEAREREQLAKLQEKYGQ